MATALIVTFHITHVENFAFAKKDLILSVTVYLKSAHFAKHLPLLFIVSQLCKLWQNTTSSDLSFLFVFFSWHWLFLVCLLLTPWHNFITSAQKKPMLLIKGTPGKEPKRMHSKWWITNFHSQCCSAPLLHHPFLHPVFSLHQVEHMDFVDTFLAFQKRSSSFNNHLSYYLLISTWLY